MKFHYSVDQIMQAFEKIGTDGRDIYRKYLVLDYIFVFCFGILMLTITNCLFTGLPRNILFVVCILRGLFDILENSMLIMVLKIFPTANTHLVSLCSYFTTFKFIMLYSWIIAVTFQIAQFGVIKMRGKLEHELEKQLEVRDVQMLRGHYFLPHGRYCPRVYGGWMGN